MKRRLACVLALTVFGLARADDDQDVEKLLKALKSDKVEVRREAAHDLALLGSAAKKALKTFVEVMQKDSDAKVRAYAVYGVKQLGDDAKSAIPDVIEVLKKDKNAEVRCIAADTLAKFGAEAKAGVPALTAALKDKTVGPHAAAALGLLGDEAKVAIPDLA